MDSAAAVREGLVEDRSGRGTSGQPEGPPKPPGSLAPLDQWDEAQCKLPVTLCSAHTLPLNRRTGRLAFWKKTVVSKSLLNFIIHSECVFMYFFFS